MKPYRLTVGALLASIGFLAMSFAAIAAPNAVMNTDADVHKSNSSASAVVNDVSEDDEVTVTKCTNSWCFITIPGPNGWVKKKYLDPIDDEGNVFSGIPFNCGITLGPGGPTIFCGTTTTPPPAPVLPYGPDTCQPGFVWRDAIPGDHVCVTPGARAAAANENAIAGSRVDPAGAYGPNSCLSGFVWREAYSGDVVCVTPARRTAVHQENIDGPSHRVLP